MTKKLLGVIVVMFIAVGLFSSSAVAGGKLWEKKLKGDIKWKQFHVSGVVLAITDKGYLYGIDPKTGNELYMVEDLVNMIGVTEIPGIPLVVPGTPFVMVVTKAGMIKPEVVRLLDASTGKQVWEMGSTIPENLIERLFDGKKPEEKDPPSITVSMPYKPVADMAHNQLLIPFLNVNTWTGKAMYTKVKGKGFAVVGLDLKTGKVNFISYIDESMKNDTVTDADLVVSGDVGVLDWWGMHSFSVIDGKPLAAVNFKRARKANFLSRFRFLNTNAPPLVEGTTAYIIAQDHLEAYDIKTGQKKWASEDLDSALPESQVAGDKVVVRMGGSFCTPGPKRDCKQFSPYGIAVLDKGTGKILATTPKVDSKHGAAMTSPLLVRDNVVYHGVSNGARAFDLGTLQYKWMKSINMDRDTPKSVDIVNDNLVLMNMQTTAAFKLSDGTPLWSQSVEPVQMDLAMMMVQALASVAATYSGLEAGRNGGVEFKKQALERWGAFDISFNNLLKNISMADEKGRYNYSMTGVAKDPNIIGVNTKTGKMDLGTQVEGRIPDYLVDPVAGILINAPKSDANYLYGFDLNPPLPKL